MDFFKDFLQGSYPFKNGITTIDSHTEGETTRLIVRGIEDVRGDTMMEKLDDFRSRHDHVRCLLTKEPRGSKDILAALVTENVTEDAAFGLIYMDAKRYPFLCGHATIGAVATLVETGFLTPGPGSNIVRVDTPSGVMETRVFMHGQTMDSVAVNMVPSFVYDTRRKIHVSGFGDILIDIVCTGGFFAMVDTDLIGVEPVLENKAFLTDLGMKIIDAANEQLTISHPVRADIRTIDVTEFYDSMHDTDPASGKGMVIYGESHADRSPCGTGTAAKLTLLHHYGKIRMNQPYINYSPLGTFFEARLIGEKTVGSQKACVVEIKGMAYITGIHHFTIQPNDPFQEGFIM